MKDTAAEGESPAEKSAWLDWVAGSAYKSAWKAVIRPERYVYSISEFGPQRFQLGGKTFQRDDMCLRTDRCQALQCSHFRPTTPVGEERQGRPCVIYLHGSSSCRLEALDVLNDLLPHDLDVFCMDFAGSGLSDGDYVSLGHFEEKDLGVAIRYLRKSGFVTSVGLWGRSMGASTAIIRAARDKCLSACVLDSPFRDLRSIARDMVSRVFPVPNWVIDMGVEIVRTEITSRAGFDPDTVAPIKSAPRARCPAIFAIASDDDLVLPHHAKELHDAWGGHCALRTFEGGHNGDRPAWFLQEAATFLAKQLRHEGTVTRVALPDPISLSHDIKQERASSVQGSMSTKSARGVGGNIGRKSRNLSASSLTDNGVRNRIGRQESFDILLTIPKQQPATRMATSPGSADVRVCTGMEAREIDPLVATCDVVPCVINKDDANGSETRYPRTAVLVKRTFRNAGAFLGVSRRRPQRRARSSGWRRGCIGGCGGGGGVGSAAEPELLSPGRLLAGKTSTENVDHCQPFLSRERSKSL